MISILLYNYLNVNISYNKECTIEIIKTNSMGTGIGEIPETVVLHKTLISGFAYILSVDINNIQATKIQTTKVLL